MGAPSAPVAVRVQGVTYVFGIGHDNALRYRPPAAGWQSLGGYLVSTPAASTDGTNLYVSGVAADGALWNEAAVCQPDVVALALARWFHHLVRRLRLPQQQRIPVRDRWRQRGVVPAGHGGTSSGWQPLGGIATSPPAATADFNGGVDVLVVGQDAAMWSQRLTAGWATWQHLGGAFISPPAASYSHVFGIGVDGHLWAADYL